MQKGDVKALELKVQEDDLLKQFVGLLDYDTRVDFTSQDKPSSAGQLAFRRSLIQPSF